MDKKKVFAILILSGAIMTLGAQPAQAYQRHWEKRHYRRNKVFGVHSHNNYHHHSYGNITFRLPRGFISLNVGGSKYHYRDGVYYRKAHHGYVVTPPPYGACISRLPHGYAKIIIDGERYYAYNGIYYEHTPQGYVVIEEPRSKHAKKGRVAKRQQQKHYDASFELSIPNRHGYWQLIYCTLISPNLCI